MRNPCDDGGTEVLNPIIFCLKRAASINDGGNMQIAEKVARGLKAASIYTGLSSYAIAKKTKINQHIVRAYFLGISNTLVYKNYLDDICKSLGVDKNNIISGKGKYGMYQGDLDGETDTICWTCKKSSTSRDDACSWAGCSPDGKLLFQPVPGWNAIQTKLRLRTKEGDSYIVISCPLYERGTYENQN